MCRVSFNKRIKRIDIKVSFVYDDDREIFVI